MTATPMKRSASLLSATTLCVTSLVVKPACVSLLAFATLQGCSMFSRSSVPGAKFLIDPPAMTPVEGAKIENILVRRFSVVPPANGLTFVYLLADGSWRTDEYNGWIADPADMFSDALATALTECGRVGMVGVEGVTVRFDFVAEGVVENLYADYSDPSKPTANVDIRIYLLDRRNTMPRLVASVHGSGTAPIVADGAPEVAKAFSVAAGAAIAHAIEAMPKDIAPAEPKSPVHVQPQKVG